MKGDSSEKPSETPYAVASAIAATESRPNASIAATTASRPAILMIAAAGLGLACHMAWVSAAFFSVQLYIGVSDTPEALLDNAYLISIIALIATFALIFRFDRKIARLLKSTRFLMFIMAMTAISTVLLALGGLGPIVGSICIVSGGVLSGVFSALLLQAWGRLYAHIANPYYSVYASILAYLLSMAIQIPFIMMNALIAISFAVLLPICSTLLLLYAKKLNHTLQPQKIVGTKQFISVPEKKNYLKSTSIRLIVTMILWCGSYEFIRTLYIKGGINQTGAFGYATSLGIATLFLCAVVAITALGLALNPKGFDMSYPYRVVLLFSILGIGLFPLSDMGFAPAIAHAVHLGAWQSFGLAMWVVTIVLSEYNPPTGTKVFAAARGCWALGGLIGILLGRALTPSLPLGGPLAIAVSLTSILIIVTCYLFVFNEKVVSVLTRFFPDRTPGRFEQKCKAIAVEYRLSPREAEVMRLLARGRNVEVIMEELTLSNATVCTHRQHIYQKLDIHSQQELINVVEAASVRKSEETGDAAS